MTKRLSIFILLISQIVFPALAQQRSAKRGLGWDEKTNTINAHHVQLLAPGVAWMYNWGITPKNAPETLGAGKDIDYAPMFWNAGTDNTETTLRAYIAKNPGTKYLLGFNEPNFSAQSNMTPQAAVNAWPRLEKLAEEYGLMLVAPALNFTGEKVGGRVWQPYEWYDEFFRLYPNAKLDCLALHCYMNWYSSNTWFATEYFYKDLYNSSKKDVYGKYPNLVAYLDKFKEAKGHFPRMMLTEFCSWENDGNIKNVDFQIDQMVQKVQKLEQSDLVEGYAWFMANGNASSYPYFSVLQTNTANAELSTLGKVYVYMSSFDTNKYYTAGETIFAKDYIDSSLDDGRPIIRPSSDTQSDAPLQVTMNYGTTTTYRINVAKESTYTFTLRVNSANENSIRMYVDKKMATLSTPDGQKSTTIKLASTDSQWTERTFSATLKAGNHDIMLYNYTNSPIIVSEFKFTDDNTSGVAATVCNESDAPVYDLQGRKILKSQHGIVISNNRKILQ